MSKTIEDIQYYFIKTIYGDHVVQDRVSTLYRYQFQIIHVRDYSDYQPVATPDIQTYQKHHLISYFNLDK